MKYTITLDLEDRYEEANPYMFTQEMIKYIERNYDITILKSEVKPNA